MVSKRGNERDERRANRVDSVPPPNELIIMGFDAGGTDGGGAYCDCRLVLIDQARNDGSVHQIKREKRTWVNCSSCFLRAIECPHWF